MAWEKGAGLMTGVGSRVYISDTPQPTSADLIYEAKDFSGAGIVVDTLQAEAYLYADSPYQIPNSVSYKDVTISEYLILEEKKKREQWAKSRTYKYVTKFDKAGNLLEGFKGFIKDASKSYPMKDFYTIDCVWAVSELIEEEIVMPEDANG